MRYLIVGAGDDNCDLTKFIPPALLGSLPHTLVEWQALTKKQLAQDATRKIARVKSLTGALPATSTIVNLYAAGGSSRPIENELPQDTARFRFSVENFGVNIAPWSMEFRSDDPLQAGYGFDYLSSNDGHNNLSLTALEPEIQKELLLESEGSDCASLAQKSLKALRGYTLKSILALQGNSASCGTATGAPELVSHLGALSGVIVMNRCILCHNSGTPSIPALPFGNPSKLKQLLGKGGYPRGTLYQEILYRLNTSGPDHMPKNGNLDPETQKSIEDYLAGLLHSD